MNIEESAQVLEAIIPYFYRFLRNEKSVFCRQFHLTPTQLDVLTVLKDENLNLSKLSELTMLDSSTLVGTVDRLEKRHLLQKKVSSKDRRQNIISLSQKGKNLLDSMPTFISPALKEMVAGLTPEERRQFSEIMQKILVNMKLKELVPHGSNHSQEIKPAFSEKPDIMEKHENYKNYEKKLVKPLVF